MICERHIALRGTSEMIKDLCFCLLVYLKINLHVLSQTAISNETKNNKDIKKFQKEEEHDYEKRKKGNWKKKNT